MGSKRGLVRERAGALLQWTSLGALVGAVCGGASALFLWLLERATTFRESHEALVYGLPIAGLVIGWIYERWGRSIKGGNNLVIDTIHDDSEQIPLRMAPMVLLGTVLTHVFGGSAGREGTAVQMGASLADGIAHRFRVDKNTRRQLLAAGMAGGFGSVFGTPIAGAIFGLEVVCIGRIEYDALAPALVASLVGDFVCRRLGVVHMAYPAAAFAPLTPIVLVKLALIGLAMALVTRTFVELTHGLKRVLEERIPRLPVRMFVGGVALVVMWRVAGTSDYLGLGLPTIRRAFSDSHLPVYAFAAKLVFTSVTLASGFLGGEVTPLFFVGATLGSVLARLLDLPIGLGAGVGLAAVFGAAANTPIALSIMSVELLGASAFPHVVVVCVTAYLLSGHRGIYPAQRIVFSKHGRKLGERPAPLREFRAATSRSSLPAEALKSLGMTTLGIIGAGRIGSQVARLAVAHGYSVVISNSRGPETLADLVEELGPNARAATADDAARAGDIVVVTIPLKRYRSVPVDPLAGKVVIDTNNYYPQRDGRIPELDDESTTTAELLQAHLPKSKVVKAFNHIYAAELTTHGQAPGTPNRRALVIAGDDAGAKAVVTKMLDAFGFDTVDAGALKEGWRIQRDTPGYGPRRSADELRRDLAQAKRYRDL